MNSAFLKVSDWHQDALSCADYSYFYMFSVYIFLLCMCYMCMTLVYTFYSFSAIAWFSSLDSLFRAERLSRSNWRSPPSQDCKTFSTWLRALAQRDVPCLILASLSGSRGCVKTTEHNYTNGRLLKLGTSLWQTLNLLLQIHTRRALLQPNRFMDHLEVLLTSEGKAQSRRTTWLFAVADICSYTQKRDEQLIIRVSISRFDSLDILCIACISSPSLVVNTKCIQTTSILSMDCKQTWTGVCKSCKELCNGRSCETMIKACTNCSYLFSNSDKEQLLVNNVQWRLSASISVIIQCYVKVTHPCKKESCVYNLQSSRHQFTMSRAKSCIFSREKPCLSRTCRPAG